MNKSNNTKNKQFTFLVFTITIVFLIYCTSLLRPWQPFDERLFYNEEFLPIPSSFTEIFKIIKSFVLNSHIVSMNNFFSNHILLRSDPVAWSILTFIFFFFKKNALLYHLLQLSLHLINTIFLWLILYNLAKFNTKDKNHFSTLDYLLISILSGIWSLHSINTEAVLLVTNWNAILIYSFCFGFILYEINKTIRGKFKTSIFENVFISLLFYFSMSIAEFGYTLPIILFLITFSLLARESNQIKQSLYLSLKRTAPYFTGLALYIFYLLIKPDSSLTNLFLAKESVYLFFERNLWLTPQIFVYFFKLLFFPKVLSTYQSNLIHLSSHLFNPYSIFCTLTYLSFLITPLVLFLILKKSRNRFFYPLVYSFYFSLFPFLHIVAPSYCLIADRYCYFPLFLLIILLCLLLINFSGSKYSKATTAFLAVILIVLCIRTYIRINEWNNPYTFFQSAISADKNPLYKAYKLIIFAGFADKDKSLNESLTLLDLSLKNTKEITDEPLTLKLYGLDSNSLLLKTVYLIATVRSDYYNEESKSVLSFYEPYIKNNINTTGINQLALYASILSKDGQLYNAKRVLEYAKKRFPYSPEILKSLANFYFYEKDFKKLADILNKGYNLFPNDKDFIRMLYNYYKLTNDKENEARFAYLIKLREHLTISIQ